MEYLDPQIERYINYLKHNKDSLDHVKSQQFWRAPLWSLYVNDDILKILSFPNKIKMSWLGLSVIVIIPIIGAILVSYYLKTLRPLILIPIMILFFVIIYFFMRYELNKGDFLIWDRVNKKIYLPRSRHSFHENDTLAIQIFETDKYDCPTCDLEILDKNLCRYSVITCEYSKDMKNIPNTLSKLMGIPTIEVQINLRNKLSIRCTSPMGNIGDIITWHEGKR